MFERFLFQCGAQALGHAFEIEPRITDGSEANGRWHQGISACGAGQSSNEDTSGMGSWSMMRTGLSGGHSGKVVVAVNRVVVEDGG